MKQLVQRRKFLSRLVSNRKDKTGAGGAESRDMVRGKNILETLGCLLTELTCSNGFKAYMNLLQPFLKEGIT